VTKRKPSSHPTRRGGAKAGPLPARAASLGAAASLLRVPPDWVSAAKAAGCAGFAAKGTVTLTPVKEWIEANLDRLKSAKGELPLRDQLLVERIIAARRDNAEADGKLKPIADICAEIQIAGGRCGLIFQEAVNELPPKIADCGGDIAAIRELLESRLDRVRAEIQALASVFEPKPGVSA